MLFPKINLHIHSNYSDGKQTIKQIVEKTIKLELDYIAITDHFTNSWKAWVSKLKDFDIISTYLDEISSFQEFLLKKNMNLTLLKGLEIDLASSEQFIKKNIQIDQFNLILFEYLQSPEAIAFVDKLINYWKNQLNDINKLPILGLAHFDPSYFMMGNLDSLLVFLKRNNIYFEFNSSYSSFYSPQFLPFFEKLKKFKIPVGIGCDSHSSSNLDDIEEPLEMIKYYNLEENLKILVNLLKQLK